MESAVNGWSLMTCEPAYQRHGIVSDDMDEPTLVGLAGLGDSYVLLALQWPFIEWALV